MCVHVGDHVSGCVAWERERWVLRGARHARLSRDGARRVCARLCASALVAVVCRWKERRRRRGRGSRGRGRRGVRRGGRLEGRACCLMWFFLFLFLSWVGCWVASLGQARSRHWPPPLHVHCPCRQSLSLQSHSHAPQSWLQNHRNRRRTLATLKPHPFALGLSVDKVRLPAAADSLSHTQHLTGRRTDNNHQLKKVKPHLSDAQTMHKRVGLEGRQCASSFCRHFP